jgi:multiple sugar transport system permease protein
MYTLSSGRALFLGQHVIQYGLIMAGSVLAIVPMVVAFLLIQRQFVESIATSGQR